jgi:hypothetical protein
MRKRLLLALCLLAPPEAVVRAFDLDFKILAPLLYYQGADLQAHEPLSDSRLYGLRRGFSGRIFDRLITVDSRGFRGPERRERKPPGVFRVLCYGSSNTYGAFVDDDGAWPAQLERELSRRLGRPVEAWNGGVSAYSLRQEAAAARLGAARFDPDLILVQPYYMGRRPFLLGADTRPAFDAEPELFVENLRWLPFGGTTPDLALLHWRTLRFLVIAANRLGIPANNPSFDSWSAETESLVGLLRSSRVPVLLVLPPPAVMSDYLTQATAPKTIHLKDLLPKGAGPAYELIHPSKAVYGWYARAIAGELARRGLLPTAR